MNSAQGFQNLLKEGHKHFSGLDEAVLRNINACKEISKLTKTSFGPNGMTKMIINHLEKVFITSDAATIMRELEVQHPAAKMIVMAAKMQDDECGDQTNFVISFAGELLTQAEFLIKMGLHTSQIISGYELALKKTIEIIEKSAVFEVKSIKDQAQVEMGLSSAISSKLFVYGQLFTKLVAQACIMSLPDESQNFDVDHIRVAKILGGSVNDSYVLHGLMIARNAEGCITRVEKPKVACYSQPLDPQNGDTKGTVLIKNAQDLLNYSKTEEELAENIVKKIADAGITLVVAGGSIAELIMHFLEKYRIMVVRITSKFDLQRICKALQAIPLARVDAPTPDEIGTCDECFVQEIGSQKVTIFKKQNKDCNLSTIVVRGSSNQLMDDIERGIEDGVNVYRNLLKDARYLPGAGSIEIKLSKTLEQEAKKLTDLNQYSYFRFGQSFEILPRILIENAGFNVNSLLPQLYTENQTETSGLDILTGQIKKVSDLKIYDHLQSKLWAIKLAADAAITVLKVDQIIIAKPAGGPKLPSKSQNWDEDQ